MHMAAFCNEILRENLLERAAERKRVRLKKIKKRGPEAQAMGKTCSYIYLADSSF